MAGVPTNPYQLPVRQHHRQDAGIKNPLPKRLPSPIQLLAVLTCVPLGGTLLTLAALTLAGSVIGLMVTFPLFIIFSPVIVPAVIVVGLAVSGFLTAEAFGLSGLTAMSWVLRYIRQATETTPWQLGLAKRRMTEMASFVGQKTKDVGESIESKAHDVQIHDVQIDE